MKEKQTREATRNTATPFHFKDVVDCKYDTNDK